MREPSLFAFFGHHKCASTWMCDIVHAVCHRLGLKQSVVYESKDFDDDLSSFVNRQGTDFLCYTNGNVKYLNQLNDFKAIHLIRDPRDIIVSGYFSHLKTHMTHAWPELIPHREKLQSVDQDQGLLLEIEFSSRFLEDMFSWNYADPRIIELRYEDIVQNPYEGVLSAFTFLGLVQNDAMPYADYVRFVLGVAMRRALVKGHLAAFGHGPRVIPRSELLDIIYTNRFAAKRRGTPNGVEDRNSHYRKGIAGDWANYFTKAHKEAFKRRYGEALIRLGYEVDNNW